MDSPLYDAFLRMTDWLFGWILFLPRDLALTVVALLTSLGLILLRKWVSDQDMLTKAVADMKILKARMKDAKQRKDKAERKRHQAVSQRIAMKRMRAEGKPLLYALIPVAILASWAFERLEFEPLGIGEPVRIELRMPLSAEGRVVHLVPLDGLQPLDGFLRLLERDPAEEQALTVIARWNVAGTLSGHYLLQFRTDAGTFEHPLQVATRRYAPVLREHRPLVSTQAGLRERKLFNLVPAIPAMGLPAWMVGYLLITIAFVVVNKRLLRVA